MLKCARCGQEFERLNFETNICGNCADDLRDEEEAKQAGDEEIARQQYKHEGEF